VRFALVEQELLAELDQELVGGLVAEAEVYEELNEFAQLVENQVLVLTIALFGFCLELMTS
jgi:hypothetical protein